MSILGALVRTRPEWRSDVEQRLRALPGVDVALDPGDGRFVVVLEDAVDAQGQACPAASTLAAIALWTDVLNTSLVYEYSGPDLGPEEAAAASVSDYRAWRGSLKDLAAPTLLSTRNPATKNEPDDEPG